MKQNDPENAASLETLARMAARLAGRNPDEHVQVKFSDFVAFETNAFNLAPFAALQPQNGGKDPETGFGFVKMDIILTVFGETLAGERVQGSARFPVNFCFNCGGCG